MLCFFSNRGSANRLLADGLHATTAKCTMRVTAINDEMLRRSITVRIQDMDARAFLSPTMYNFTEGLSEIFKVPAKVGV